MKKLFKYLKDYKLYIFFIVILLALQAYSELSLPSYTSDIVNVGIQQNGIDTALPEVVRASEMSRLEIFMTEEQRDLVDDGYTLVSAGDSQYVKDYPVSQTEDIYVLETKDKKQREDMEAAFSLPMLIVFGIESGGDAAAAIEDQLTAQIPETLLDSLRDENGRIDLFALFAMMSEDQLQALAQQMTDQMSQMPDMLMEQMGIQYLQSEYKAVGMDLNQMQSHYILVAGAKMLGLALFAMAVSVAVTFLSAKIAASMSRNLRRQVFHKVISFSSTEFDKFSTASLITRSTNDIQQVQMLTVMLLRMVIYSPIIALGGIYKVFQTNGSMWWTLVIGVIAIFIVVGILFTTVMPKFKVMQKLVDRVNLVTREILTGLPVIRAFSTEEHEKERFDKANKDLLKNNLFVNRAMSCMMPLMMLIMNLLTVLIVWAGAGYINDGVMQVGDMMAFIQYAMMIIMSFLMLSMVSVMLPRAAVAAERVDEIITTDLTIHEPESPKAMDDSHKKGYVEFDDVSFRYPGADEDVLSHLTFTAKLGQTTAIIGSTGSGKSTLVNLIPRFFDVTGGTIRVDGQDIREVSGKDLRDRIGYVPQKGMLFSGTIETNIKYSDHSLSDERMVKAARIAQAEEFISAKPDQYDSVIAQGGNNVSGGQKQRLSIARAIAKDPEIYIFDDSFSALDYKTDAVLRRALRAETAESTVIIVAQRISTILNADQILVLDEGHIVGKGTHEQLLEDCEVYRQIATSQLSEAELKGGKSNE